MEGHTCKDRISRFLSHPPVVKNKAVTYIHRPWNIGSSGNQLSSRNFPDSHLDLLYSFGSIGRMFVREEAERQSYHGEEGPKVNFIFAAYENPRGISVQFGRLAYYRHFVQLIH